jgi:hypothetical protein
MTKHVELAALVITYVKDRKLHSERHPITVVYPNRVIYMNTYAEGAMSFAQLSKMLSTIFHTPRNLMEHQMGCTRLHVAMELGADSFSKTSKDQLMEHLFRAFEKQVPQVV